VVLGELHVALPAPVLHHRAHRAVRPVCAGARHVITRIVCRCSPRHHPHPRHSLRVSCAIVRAQARNQTAPPDPCWWTGLVFSCSSSERLT
jgi:hypothetical protein